MACIIWVSSGATLIPNWLRIDEAGSNCGGHEFMRELHSFRPSRQGAIFLNIGANKGVIVWHCMSGSLTMHWMQVM